MICIAPDWPAPKSVKALVSTRSGGVSQKPFDSLNLGDHVGDRIEDVMLNRAVFSKKLPANPIWLNQTHSTVVSTPKSRELHQGVAINADASVTNLPGEVLTIMTADCLPVLFANSNGTVVGAAHAGWRGLCAGILENTIAALKNLSDSQNSADLMVWLGPAIGSDSFEVGEDVVRAFKDAAIPFQKNAFKPIPNKPGKFMADIYLLAKGRLEACGISIISGGEYCTVRDHKEFFSYRRDGQTGRFATAIWISQ